MGCETTSDFQICFREEEVRSKALVFGVDIKNDLNKVNAYALVRWHIPSALDREKVISAHKYEISYINLHVTFAPEFGSELLRSENLPLSIFLNHIWRVKL